MRRFTLIPLLLLTCLAVTAQAALPLGEPLYEVQGAFDDVVVSRNLAFFAVREAGSGEPDVRIYRLGKKGQALLAGDYYNSNSDGAYGLDVAGNYLYLANGDKGLEIIDVRNPAQPRQVALQPLKGFSHQVKLQRGLAFVASGFGGMHVVDVRRPQRPRLLSTYQAYPSPMERAIEQPMEEAGLFPKDGSNPGQGLAFGGDQENGYYEADDLPAYEGVEEDVPMTDVARKEGALDLAVGGGVAYLAYASAGIIVVDISDPRRPGKMAEVPFNHPVERVLLKGGTLYATAGIAGVQRLNISQPATPVQVSSCRTNCYPQGVAVAGHRVYVADGYCGSDGLLLLDLRPGTRKRITGSLAGTVGNVRVSGDWLFAMGLEKTRVFDLSAQ
jgi:hypothetical protein